MRKHRNNNLKYNLEDLYDLGSAFHDTEVGNVRSNHDKSVRANDRGRVNDMDRSKTQMSTGEISIFSPHATKKATKLK